MAHNDPDPIQDLIAEGKIRNVPYEIDFKVVVLEISLDRLAENLIESLDVTYGQWEPLLTRYSGTRDEVTQAIKDDVTNMVDFALWVTYNRLRAVAERYSPPDARTKRMKHRAPCSNRMEFPTFLSSTLQGIGPLRIVDAPKDVMVIYAPPDNTADNYGRGGPREPNEGKYRRLLSLLRALNVQCSPIDLTPTQGSFATTCKFTFPDDLVSIVGSVHRSHYTNDDIKKFLLLAYNPDRGNMPFAYIDNIVSTVYLAERLAAYDINSILRYHLTRTG